MKIPNHPNTQIPKLARALTLLGIWVLGYLGTCSAEITATVYPGYVLGANERPTTSILNLLGRPTVLVSGTLGGTNVALAANSVTTTMMSDTLPGSNLVWDSSSPRKLVLANQGADTNQISTNIAGLGLGGGGGAPLSNKTDNAFIQITNDVLTISLSGFTNLIAAIANQLAATNAAFYATNYATTNRFVSYDYSISSAGAVASTNHGLGGTPQSWKWVLHCITADSPYAVGAEIDMGDAYDTANEKAFARGADSTNVFCSRTSDTATGNVEWKHQTTGAAFQPTLARWKARCYARP